MKRDTLIGLALIAIAGLAGFAWWRNRSAGSVGSPALPGAKDSLGALQQVGSNFNQEVSTDAIKTALDFTAELIRSSGPYWYEASGCDAHGNTVWKRSDNPTVQRVLPCGQRPLFIAAGP